MFKEILLPVDLGDPGSSKKALSVAIELSQSAGARLHVLTVVPGFGMSIVSQYFPKDFEKNVVEETEKQLAAFVAQRLPPEIEAQPMVALGTIYEEILGAAKRIGADLIVMAAHRPGLQDYLLGPNASRVVRHSKGSVMVVRD